MPVTETDQTGHPIVFFDGVCNLCNRSVQFILRHDRSRRFRFASLQSEAGMRAQAEMKNMGMHGQDSVILYNKGKYYTQSSAVIRIGVLLGGIWFLAASGWLLPRFVRNGIYRWIARNRYRWFGKKDSCMVPAPGLKERFLT